MRCALSAVVVGICMSCASVVHAGGPIQAVAGYREIPGGIVKEAIMVVPRPGTHPSSSAVQVLKATQASAGPPYPILPAQSAWSQFYDPSLSNFAIVQYYNPARDPTGAGLLALHQAQNAWSSVPGSSFRFKLGGNTMRCPSLSHVDCVTGMLRDNNETTMDGFNDVAWASLTQYEQSLSQFFGVDTMLLATVTLAFVDDFVHPVEVDIVLNQDIAPFAYFTDGKHQFDLEELVLRWEGFAAGLDYSWDPHSVMHNQDPAEGVSLPVLSTLSSADKATLANLYPKKPALIVDAVTLAKGYDVLSEGDPFFGDGYAEVGAINARGDVAFVTNFFVPNSYVGQALRLSSGDGTLKEVARSGVSFAGTLLGGGSLDAVGVNDGGDVAFCWLVGSFDSPYGTNGGVFRATSNGSQQAVMLPGVTPAPGGGVFVDCFTTSISNDGDIAFTGLVQRDTTAPVEVGAYIARRDGSITRVAGPGDPAPGGGTFSGVFFARISPNGSNVAFDALVDGDTQHYGAYVRRGEGRIESVARPGDPAAGGDTIVSAIQPRVNSRGQVLYAAQLLGAPPPNSELMSALFLADQSGRSQVIARPGDVLADGYLFNGLIVSMNSWTLNDSADVAFVAVSEISPSLPFSFNYLPGKGIYGIVQGKPVVVAREKSFLAGRGDASLSVDSVPNPAVINARGDIVFRVTEDSSPLNSLLLRVSAN